jgi:hypothetical protein
MNDLVGYKIHTTVPTRFTERGVAAPFTAPRLQGARVRGSVRGGPEYLLPNPSGQRGVYIFDWAGVREHCRPTLHDMMLHQRLPQTGPITPAVARRAAIDVAAEGAAGHAAKTAALATRKADHDSILLTNFLLLLSLLEQVEPTGLSISIQTPCTAELDQRARDVMRRVASEQGGTPAIVADALYSLAAILAPVGIGAEAGTARLARLIERVRTARRDIEASVEAVGPAVGLCDAITTQADLAHRVLAAARHEVVDLRGLLRSWLANPAPFMALCGRAEWVLNGWDMICVLWETSDDPVRRQAAIYDMAPMIPTLPGEVLEWAADGLNPDSLEPARRLARHHQAWRAGFALHHAIARAEQRRGFMT